MIAVGIGSGIDDDELEEIADGKRENAIHVDAFNQLLSNENNILYASCQPGNFKSHLHTLWRYFASPSDLTLFFVVVVHICKLRTVNRFIS